MNKTIFQNMVRRILNEEISKRVPEMDNNGLNVDAKDKDKVFPSDPNSRDVDTKEEMQDQLAKAVKAVDKSFIVAWNDHDDLTINGGDMLYVWITPLWEDNYKIVYMPRNEDRYFFTGLNWKQVLDFVKNNLSQKTHTGVEKARDKSWRNREDQIPATDKGLNQKDKPKTMSTDKPFSKEKNKDKRYVEDQVTNEDDLPDKPMKEVEKFKKQDQHKVTTPVKLRRHKPNTKLTVKQT